MGSKQEQKCWLPAVVLDLEGKAKDMPRVRVMVAIGFCIPLFRLSS